MTVQNGAGAIFRVADKVKTPLALAGVVVIVLYLVFSHVLSLQVFSDVGPDNTFSLFRDVLWYVFWLAIVAVVLGIGAFVLAMLLKHRIEMQSSNVQLVDARLDPHDSPYEQAIVDGKRQIRPQKRSEQGNGICTVANGPRCAMGTPRMCI